jgi:hypothetical protein
LHSPPCHRARGEAVVAVAACGLRRAEQRPGQVVTDGGGVEPGVEALEGFRVQRDAALLAALAVNL